MCSGDHPFSEGDVAAAREVLARTLAAGRDIAAGTDAGLQALVHGYMRINALCIPAGHPRCEVRMGWPECKGRGGWRR